MFELDGRVIRSIKSIVLHPGQLSLAFAENRRADFVNPFRLFMFTTIIWFFLFGIKWPTPDDPLPRETSRVVLDEREGTTVHGPGPIRLSLDRDDEDIEQSEADLAAGMEILRGHLEGDRARKFDDLLAIDGSTRRLGPIRGVAWLLSAEHGMPQWMQRILANVVVDAVHSPQLLLNEFLDNLPLMMVVLLPWYAILLMVFFGRHGMRFIHHLVFAIHVHSFSFIVLTIVLLTPGSDRPGSELPWYQDWDVFNRLVIVLLMIHTYFAFRRFYRQNHLRTLIKYFSLGFFYLWGLLPAFSFVLVLLLTDYL